MIAFGHTSVGVIIAGSIIAVSPGGTPSTWGFVLAIVLGVALHYVTDLIPHGHYYIDTKHLTPGALMLFSVDLFGAALLFLGLSAWKFGLWSPQFWLVVVAIAASQLTDVVEGLAAFRILPKSKPVRAHSRFHMLIHWHNEPGNGQPGGGRPLRWSDLWQVLAFGLALAVVLVG